VRKQEDKSLEEGDTQLGNTVESWGTWGSSSRFGGVGGTWRNLAYSPRHPRVPNTPNCAKSRQVPCHLPDARGLVGPRSPRFDFGSPLAPLYGAQTTDSWDIWQGKTLMLLVKDDLTHGNSATWC